jgi:hypothetical protein
LDSSSPGQPAPVSILDLLADHTKGWKQFLELHEGDADVPIESEAFRASVLAAVEREARLQVLRARRSRALAAGRRAATVSARWNRSGKVPFLRLSGRWLLGAGFGIGQAFEVEVRSGELTIRAVP